MNINNLPKYDPNLSDKKEYINPADGIYTLQFTKITPMPLTLAGDEGEKWGFTIFDGEFKGCYVSFTIYTKVGDPDLKWKIPASQNMAANFVDCIGKHAAGDSHNLLKTLADAKLETKPDKQGRNWTNIKKFFKTDKKIINQVAAEEDIDPSEIPF
jgi:hypothetical protein